MNQNVNPLDVVAELFLQTLESSTDSGASLCIAFSGGMDSTVLLHVAAQQNIYPVRAVYINHGLQAEADAWATHCGAVCDKLGVAFTALKVNVDSRGEQGLESAARSARYAALHAELVAGEILLTAHHQHDQMETFFIQLLRGAGVHGLAAMPVCSNKDVTHLRPLLAVPANLVREYADAASLDWIEDPSNNQREFDRNFVRHEILPVIQQRWPAASRSVARAARHTAEAAALLDDLASNDLQGWVEYPRLRIEGIAALSPQRKSNALRYQLRSWDMAIPSEAQLASAIDSLFDSRIDAQPEAAWPGVRIRLYRGTLWFFSETTDPLAPIHCANSIFDWDSAAILDMGSVRGRLESTKVQGEGIAERFMLEPLHVRFRQGGERLRPAARGSNRQLKNLLQERDILPWMRGHIPLIYSGDQLLAVADLWVDAAAAAGPGEAGRRVQWQGYTPIR
jgi:tRNA(Ile)-lysidine synthase